MRILIAPVEVAGYAAGLQEGLSQLDVEADVLDLSGNPYSYPIRRSRSPELLMLAAAVARRRRSTGVSRLLLVVGEAVVRTAAAIATPMRYDAIVYLYGATIAGPLDPIVARLTRRPTVAVYLGSDSRPPYLDGQFADPEGGASMRRLARLTRQTARRVRRMERLVSYVIDHPCTGHFHERPFLDFLAIGLPTVARPEARAEEVAGTVRIVHAPTAPRWKGSSRIRQAVEDVAGRVREHGVRVDFVELRGVPTSEVHYAIASCDLVIDQIYSDTAIAGIGTEAATMGVPALTFGYAIEQLRGRMRAMGLSMRHYDHPDQLASQVHRYVLDRRLRAEVGAELSEFVAREWAPIRVAERFIRLFDSDPEASWWVRPDEVTYCSGWGMSEETSAAVLGRLVRDKGAGSLQVRRPMRDRLVRRIPTGTAVTAES